MPISKSLTIADTFTVNLGHCDEDSDDAAAASASGAVDELGTEEEEEEEGGGFVRSMRPRSRPLSTKGAKALMAITSAASLVETWSSFKSHELTRRTSTWW